MERITLDVPIALVPLVDRALRDHALTVREYVKGEDYRHEVVYGEPREWVPAFLRRQPLDVI